jgi:anaerobic magnesium-protoporphyrin IX monomethyl ester cyclase
VRILFVEVDTTREWACAAIGPAFIAAFLRAQGHEVSLYRAGVDKTPEEIVSDIRAASPELLGISLTTRQWLRARDLVKAIRTEIDVPVVAGGLHPTFSPTQVLESPGFDYVCLGEGEEPMLDLVAALENGEPTSGIDNIWTAGGTRPALRPPFQPLDDMPFMARDMLDEYEGCVHMTTQRGCPFPCTYCAARMYNELYEETANYGRRRSHTSVLEELFEIQRNGSLAYVIFLDDTFTIYRRWVKEFCRVYGERLRIPFSLHARVETVTEEMIGELAAAGCQHIAYGVESGSLRVRRDIMQRAATNERIKDVFRWTREAGIMVTANYMLGLPGETRDDLQQTFDLALELQAFDFGYFVFYPYPGTALFRLCLEKGYLPGDYLEREANHRESILSLPDLTADDIAEYYDRFTALRERQSLERANGSLSSAAQSTIRESVKHLAATG